MEAELNQGDNTTRDSVVWGAFQNREQLIQSPQRGRAGCVLMVPGCSVSLGNEEHDMGTEDNRSPERQVGQYPAHPKECDCLSRWPWEGTHCQHPTATAAGIMAAPSGVRTDQDCAKCFRFFFHPCGDSVQLEEPELFPGEGAHPRSQGFEPTRLAQLFPCVLCCSRP